MGLTAKQIATAIIQDANMHYDFQGEYTQYMVLPKLDHRNSYFTQQLGKSVWEELLIGILYNGKTLKTNQKNS